MADSENKEVVDEVPLVEETKEVLIEEAGIPTPKDKEPSEEQTEATIASEGVGKSSDLTTEQSVEEAKIPAVKAAEISSTKPTETAPSSEDLEFAEERPPLPDRGSSTRHIPQNPILVELTEAFPGIEVKYVNAVLIASQGALDPAFNALLFLSDPSFEAEAAVPTAPPDNIKAASASAPINQLEQDEILARQLDAQFNKSRTSHGQSSSRTFEDERIARNKRIRNRQKEYERGTAQGRRPLTSEEEKYYNQLGDEDEEDDFISQLMDKDLPEIREKFGRQVQETGKKVNEWISGFRKNWSQEQSQDSRYSDYPEYSQRGDASQTNSNRRRSSSGSDYEHYARPEHRTARFNSFGAKEGDDSVDTSTRLASHGISIYNKDANEGDQDDDVGPQLPSRNKPKDVQPETTYIDTPEAGTRKKWQPLSPEPMVATPSKTNVTASKKKTRSGYDDNENEFLINSDDEL
ncbi:LANO_0H23134g1_1 [Lachancea nothofagi CBS 11611]|uniref:LANO_0H23134g1_1 n=1 Tax=Lachancea nothofagi CBS 11611 TaxID=1266666 RepID=A0A1G4KNY6_9SACH|nr:LANO_0H23134g1_1 [Lachancea nothofagi CBS 11611]